MLLRMNTLIFYKQLYRKIFQLFGIIKSMKIDEFFMRYFGGGSRFATLIVIVKFVMILSHGQWTGERGFSINKSLLIENLSEKSFTNQRIVC